MDDKIPKEKPEEIPKEKPEEIPNSPPTGTDQEANETREDENRTRKIFLVGILSASVIIFVILVSLVLAFTLSSSSGSVEHKHSVALNERRNKGPQGRRLDKIPKSDIRDNCSSDPPLALGFQRLWDEKSYAQGTTVNYTCQNNKTGIEDLYMITVCLNGEWHQIVYNDSDCILDRCSEEPPKAEINRTRDWDKSQHSVGSRVTYRCSSLSGAPSFRIMVCDITGAWVVEEETLDNCTCGWPEAFPSPLYFDRNQWNGRKSVGERVNYSCPLLTLKSGKNFMVLECQQDLHWKVIESETCYFLVGKALNATKASDYCQDNLAELLVMESPREHRSVVSLLVKNHIFSKNCHHKAFIGLREDISQQWTDSNGESLSIFSDMWGWQGEESDATCSFIVRENYHLGTSSCKKSMFCHLCQFENVTSNELLVEKCKDRSPCIIPVGPATHFNEAKEQCERANGRLASVIGFKMLEMVRQAVEGDAKVKDCNGFYTGLQSDNRIYETLTGGMKAPVLIFGEKRFRNPKKHCVVVHEFERFRWTDEFCFQPNCFICKARGIPVGTVVPSGENIPLLFKKAEQDMIGSLITDDRDDEDVVTDENNCLVGWVHKGHHCFYYNKSMATNAEAAAVCSAHKSVLASLANAYERNFILDHLMNFYANVAPLWHVQDSAGLPFYQLEPKSPTIDDGSGSCVLLHLQPKLSWSRESCNRKASFVCHSH